MGVRDKGGEILAMKLKVVLYPGEDGGYSVEVPALPGRFSEGDSLAEALAKIKEAAAGWLGAAAARTEGEAEPGAKFIDIEL